MAAATNYHKLYGLNKAYISYVTLLEVRSLNWFHSALGIREEFISLPFPPSKGHPHSLAYDPFFFSLLF
jgi:hypothetical protein